MSAPNTTTQAGARSEPRGFTLLREIPRGTRGTPRGNCEGCGRFIWSEGGYRVPGVRGISCSIECIETVLFGGAHCRWCGAAMSNSCGRDDTIKARLCSEDCSANYYAHVLGDRSAALGTGKRFLLWLQRHQPSLYRQLIGVTIATKDRCQNQRCRRGEDGTPASIIHLRAGSRYCCDACRVEANRNGGSEGVLTSVFEPPQTRQKCGFSRNKSAGKGFPANPPNFGVSRHDSGFGAKSVGAEAGTALVR